MIVNVDLVFLPIAIALEVMSDVPYADAIGLDH
jgi:hypothetical protein